jgi:hypothetical protein
MQQTHATLKVVETAAAAFDGLTGENSAGGGAREAGAGGLGEIGGGGDGSLGEIVDQVFHTTNQHKQESDQRDKTRVMETAAAEVAAAAKAYSGGAVSALKNAQDALAMALSPPPLGQAYSPPPPGAMASLSARFLPGFDSSEDGVVLNPPLPPFTPLSPPSPRSSPSPPPLGPSTAAAATPKDKAELAAAVSSDRVTIELSAELNHTMLKAETTAKALDKLYDITSEIIGAMSTRRKHRWDVSSAVARARSRLYDVKSVLNTTAETDAVLALTLIKLQEEKEVQAAEVLRVAVEAANKAGALGHDVNELLALLESVEYESKKLPGLEGNDTDPTAAAALATVVHESTAGGIHGFEPTGDSDDGTVKGEGADIPESVSSFMTALTEGMPPARAAAAMALAGDDSADAESLYDKVASMAKLAAEKAVETEVNAVMAKAEAKSDAVVERAAEIARQLALGDLMNQEPEPIPAMTAASAVATTAARTASDGVSDETIVNESTSPTAAEGIGISGTGSDESASLGTGVTRTGEGGGFVGAAAGGKYTELSSDQTDMFAAIEHTQRIYVPLMDSNFYRAKESDAAEEPDVDKLPPGPSMNWGAEMQKYMTKVTTTFRPERKVGAGEMDKVDGIAVSESGGTATAAGDDKAEASGADEILGVNGGKDGSASNPSAHAAAGAIVAAIPAGWDGGTKDSR